MSTLSVAADVLSWSGDSASKRDSIEREFTAFILTLADATWDSDAERFTEGLDAGSLTRVLFAPRTVRRLIWTAHEQRADIRRFLSDAIELERALPAPLGHAAGSGWTADCRAYVKDGVVALQPLLAGVIPIDTRSPHARSVDLEGGSRPVQPARADPPAAYSEFISSIISDAFERIRSAEKTVAECVVAWSRTIVAQSDDSANFSSGSNGQYIGRVVLANLDASRVTVEAVAEAMVHEAIHGFLYMHESVNPWTTDLSLYTSRGDVISPWTGACLPVRAFLQACFVWFGLAMFWASHVLKSPVFEPQQVRTHFERAIRGFQSGLLVDRLSARRDVLNPDVLDAIRELQHRLLAAV